MSVEEAWEHIQRIAAGMGVTAQHLLDMVQERASTSDAPNELRQLRRMSREILHVLYRIETGQTLGRTTPSDLADRIYKARKANGEMTRERLSANMKGVSSMLLGTHLQLLNGSPEEHDTRPRLITKLLKAYKSFL